MAKPVLISNGQLVDETGIPINLANQVGSRIPGQLVGYDEIDTSESTASATYVDLATAGPSVTFTVPTGEVWSVLAEFSVRTNNPGGGTSLVTPKLDATAADDADSLTTDSSATMTLFSMSKYTGLTAGQHTIKLQYRTSAGTPAFTRRRLKVTLVAST